MYRWLLLLVATAAASDVIVLTDANFDSSLKASGGSWLIEFYAPWCGHCQRLAPTYEKLATSLKGKVNVAKVDCTENSQTGSRFGIGGYPTIKLINNAGTEDALVYDYNGGRKEEEMSQWATDGFASLPGGAVPVAGAALAEDSDEEDGNPEDLVILTDANMTVAIESRDAWLVQFHAPWCPHCKKMTKAWRATATKFKQEFPKIKVAALDGTSNHESMKRFKIESFPTIRMISEGKVYTYEGAREVDDFATFAEEYKNKEAVDIPPVPGFKDELVDTLHMIKSDLVNLWHYKKLAMFLIYIFGVLCGVILLAILSPAPPKRVAKPATAKQAPQKPVEEKKSQ